MAYTTINKPGSYFNTFLHTGNGTTPYSFTGVGFQPDWIWGKGRNNTFSHALFDSVRGVNKYLSSNSTGAEATNPTSGYLSSFDSDGFTAVAGTSNFANFNDNTINTPSTYVFWNWKANGAGVSNTSGTITSTVSANTTSGFSIVSYTGNGTSGASIGHGLGATPAMIICKDRSAGEEWSVYHQSLTYTKYIVLESTAGAVTNSRFYQAPTSSLFYVSDSFGVNKNNDNYIAYCFAEVKGFSKFGSYTGNGADDGTFVYTGFKPAFVIRKRTDTTSDWQILDNKRTTYNVIQTLLFANTSEADATAAGYSCDFLSNGFKMRTSNAGNNASGGTYIYMAFAENPFVSSTLIPTTAR